MGCLPCSTQILDSLVDKGTLLGEVGQAIELVGASDWGVTIPSRKFTRLSCRSTEQMWFDLMLGYGDLGKFLSGFSMVSLILYFVTSSDSGSLVIDCLASNGHPNPPHLQRLLWAVLEGLTATALLVAGGQQSLQALQACAIATGLVYTVLMCVACLALWRALVTASGDGDMKTGRFQIELLDPLLTDPFQELFSAEFRSRSITKLKLFCLCILNILVAPVSVAKSCKLLFGSWTFLPSLLVLYLLLCLVPVLHALQLVVDGSWALATVSYLFYAFFIGCVRSQARTKLNIPGNPLEDFALALVLYPAVALQLIISLEAVINVTPEKKKFVKNLNLAGLGGKDAALTE